MTAAPSSFRPVTAAGFPPSELRWPTGYKFAVVTFCTETQLMKNVLSYAKTEATADREHQYWASLPKTSTLEIRVINRNQALPAAPSQNHPPAAA